VDILYVVTNGNGSADRVVVYETRCGDVVFDGPLVLPGELFGLLDVVAGGYDKVKQVTLTDTEMLEWGEHL
jgi:hypothetical protein